MAQIIDDLTGVTTPLEAADVLWIERSGLPFKVSISQLRSDMGGGTPVSGAFDYGYITDAVGVSVDYGGLS